MIPTLTRTAQRRLCGIAALLATSSLALAQSTQPPANAPAPRPTPAPGVADPDSEEILELSPFVVSAEEDDGYQATSTLAGTRLRTNLRDVGSAISVVTQQFLQDTDSRSVEQLLVYTTNTEIGGVGGNISGIELRTGGSVDETGTFTRQNTNNRIRGIGSADNTRDYFITDIPSDSYNIARYDIQRGPNAILFGLGNPAGVVNAGLNQATFRNTRKVANRVDSFGGVRFEGDFNQVLLKDQLSLRVSLLNDSKKYRQKPTFEDDRRFYGALRYDPKFLARAGARTSFRVNYEHGEIDAMRPRTLPPIDRISAWFSETPLVSPANTITGKPEATYQPLNRQLYDNWLARNYLSSVPSSGATLFMRQRLNPTNANNATRLYTPGYVQNPYFQPWVSEVFTDGVLGFSDALGGGVHTAQVGTSAKTLQYGFNNTAGNDYKTKITEGGVLPDGGIGYFRYSQYLAISAPFLVYTDLQLPFAAAYRDPQMINRNVFDFINNNLDADTRRSWRNFDSVSAAVDQTFLNNRAGFSLQFDHQDYADGSHAIFNDRTQAVTVDINATLPGGNTPNPNAGRALMLGDGNHGRMTTNRQEVKAQAFIEGKATDFLDKSWVTDVIGRHTFTGMAMRNVLNRYSYGYRRFQLNPDDVAGIIRDTEISSGNYNYRAQMYISKDSLTDRTKYPTMDSLRLSAPVGYQTPDTVEFTYFDSHWIKPTDPTAPGYVNPNATWLDPFSNGNSSQKNNPENYAGWKTKTVRLMDSMKEGDRDKMMTSFNKRRLRVSSKAFVWQGFLFSENLVPTFGYREDTQKNFFFNANSGSQFVYRPADLAVPGRPTPYPAQPWGYRTQQGFVIADSPNLDFYPAVLAPNASEYQPGILRAVNRSWSIVGHAPNFIRRHLPWGTAVSISYNESTNYDPGAAGRQDIYGNFIEPPQGKTRDIGILVSTLDNRLNFRVIKYKSSSVSSSTSSFNSGLDRLKQIETRSWAAAKRMEDAIKAQRTTDYLYQPLPGVTPYSSSFDNPNFLYGTKDPNDGNRILYASQAEKDQLLARAQATVDLILKNTPADMFKSWNIPLDSEIWRTSTDPGAWPPGRTSTQDRVSEGWEYELTAQPTKQWRVTGNFSTTKAVNTNSHPVAKEWVFARNDFWNGPAGLFTDNNPGREQGIQVDNWNTNVMGGLTQQLLADGSAVQEAVRKRANLITTYSFDKGFLKGFSIGGGYRWEDKATIGYYYKIVNFEYESRGVKKVQKFEVPDLEKPIEGEMLHNFDLWMSYQRKLTKTVTWKVQVNVRNVGDSAELVPIATWPDGSVVQYRIKDGMNWSLTNTFNF